MVIKIPEYLDYKFCPKCSETLLTRIEEDRERKYCPNCGWKYFPSPALAVAAVIICDDKVVMVQRNRMPFIETFMFPAGFVEPEEDLSDAVSREVREETGLFVTQLELMTILQSHDDPRAPGHFVIFFRVQTIGGIKNGDKKENKFVGRFPIMNPPDIGFPTHKFVMNILQNERRK